VITLDTLELFQTEEAVMLPEREALAFINLLRLTAVNVAVAGQSRTLLSSNSASAGQAVIVVQR
jgi:hypothetical protein